MKTFEINTKETSCKDLSQLNEDYIIINSISSQSIDNLLNQQFEVFTNYTNNETFKKTIYSGAYITPYTSSPKIELNFEIEECRQTKITVLKPQKNAIYTFYYTDLKELLKQKKRLKGNNSLEIDRRTKNWISNIKTINKEIESWIKPLSNDVKLEKNEIIINEEKIGEYQAERLTLTFLDNVNIVFEPVGTYILGAYGRINIISNNKFFNNYILVLQEIEGDKKWFIIKNRDNGNKKEFNKSQLFKVIQDAIS